MRREYTARAFDPISRCELHADVGQGPSGQIIRIVATGVGYGDSRTIANATPADAAVLGEQLIHLANVIRDQQGRRP